MENSSPKENGEKSLSTWKLVMLVIAIAILGLYGTKLGYRFGMDLASANAEAVSNYNQVV